MVLLSHRWFIQYAHNRYWWIKHLLKVGTHVPISITGNTMHDYQVQYHCKQVQSTDAWRQNWKPCEIYSWINTIHLYVGHVYQIGKYGRFGSSEQCDFVFGAIQSASKNSIGKVYKGNVYFLYCNYSDQYFENFCCIVSQTGGTAVQYIYMNVWYVMVLWDWIDWTALLWT